MLRRPIPRLPQRALLLRRHELPPPPPAREPHIRVCAQHHRPLALRPQGCACERRPSRQRRACRRHRVMPPGATAAALAPPGVAPGERGARRHRCYPRQPHHRWSALLVGRECGFGVCGAMVGPPQSAPFRPSKVPGFREPRAVSALQAALHYNKSCEALMLTLLALSRRLEQAKRSSQWQLPSAFRLLRMVRRACSSASLSAFPPRPAHNSSHTRHFHTLHQPWCLKPAMS